MISPSGIKFLAPGAVMKPVKTQTKKLDFDVHDVRRFLEPGPIVLVSSSYKGERDIMTMGWHMVMDEGTSRIACFIWDQNHSFDLIRKSKECVINVPTTDMAATVVKIGNSTGAEIDKFEEFGLTAVKGDVVLAPLIDECFASFECKLVDSSQVKRYSLFIFEVVKAHVAASPKFPKTLHYRGHGLFMVSGPTTSKWKKYFKPEMLEE